jgi:hypothetical protein
MIGDKGLGYSRPDQRGGLRCQPTRGVGIRAKRRWSAVLDGKRMTPYGTVDEASTLIGVVVSLIASDAALEDIVRS